MDSPKCIEDLSDEILVEIFSHLGFEDLVHSVQYVALRWRDIAHDIHLWKDLVYRPLEDVHDDEIVEIIQQAPKLQTLLLEQRAVCPSVIRALVENCTHLKKLKFHVDQNCNFLLIRNLVQNCSNIVELCIPGINLSKIKSAQCIGQLQNVKAFKACGRGHERLLLKPLGDGCPSLQHIDIIDQHYNIDDLKYFLNKKQHQLQSLNVSCSSEVGGECVIPLLLVCKTLKTLHLHDYCDINDEAFDTLRSLKWLTELCFSYLNGANINRVIRLFNDRAMSQLVKLKIVHYDNYDDRLAVIIAKNCPLLKVLHIKFCYRWTGIGRSLQNLHGLKMLEELHLSNYVKITEKGMEFLSKCKHLKHLTLLDCYNETEECMKKVTDLSRTLETLTLAYCNVKGLAIHNIPSHLPNLSLLNLDYCEGVDWDALKKLKIAVPQLTVLASDG